ncbi:MAG: hypothetical protein H7338_06310 [Candidatus Sericytochromatia bacterium]|nr:hypothetical protein [Candidatus Sericytochromatia bacterium]
MGGRFSTKGYATGPGRAGRFKQVYRDDVQLYPDTPHDAGAAPAGVMVCAGCHAVYERKHWHFNEADFARLHQAPETLTIERCPGCQRIADRDFRGELTLVGVPALDPLDPRHQRLVATEVQARETNPIARLAEINGSPGRWQVSTTTAALAVRMGTELQKAFGGQLTIDKPPRTDLARVQWTARESHVR